MIKFSATLDYLTMEEMIEMIDEPQRGVCRRILKENRELFEIARGSTHNHHTWEGGYIDHVTDYMNYARHLYAFNKAFGRPLPFSLSDALLVLFLHDIEKPWRILVDKEGGVSNHKDFATKETFKAFREKKLAEYGLRLTPAQANALAYTEGENKDYSSKRRASNELAALCHQADSWSARGWYDHPRAFADEWAGAERLRTGKKNR